MTKSELLRKLLYRGHEDMVDYLRNSPFNRCVYNLLLSHGPKPLEIPMLAIFNEVYYLCVCINYEANPETDMVARYMKEETVWLKSRSSAMLVFSVVCGMLRCKEEKTFNEQCFLDQYDSLKDTGQEESLSNLIVMSTIADQLFPPKQFRPMPTPANQLPMIANREECNIWKQVTNNFSHETIEHYLSLYETPEDQNILLDFIQGSYTEVVAPGDKSYNVKFYKLHEGIIQGKYHQKTVETENTVDVSMSSKKQLDKQQENTFTFTEMVEIVKARFSKSAAEEFANMLYSLAFKHGYMDEEICKAIDDIVPSILERDKASTTVQIPSAGQVNVNPQQVINQKL